LKRRGDKFESNAFSAQFLGNFRMPDSHPAMAVGFKLQIAALPILLDLKPALDYPGCVAHIDLAFSVCLQAPVLSFTGSAPLDFS
jgi:hypothetical protein